MPLVLLDPILSLFSTESPWVPILALSPLFLPINLNNPIIPVVMVLSFITPFGGPLALFLVIYELAVFSLRLDALPLRKQLPDLVSARLP